MYFKLTAVIAAVLGLLAIMFLPGGPAWATLAGLVLAGSASVGSRHADHKRETTWENPNVCHIGSN